MPTLNMTIEKITSAHDYPQLLPPVAPPCVSIYLPVSPAFGDANTNRLTWRKLVDQVDASLSQRDDGAEVAEQIVHSLRSIDDDETFWRSQGFGMIAFANANEVRVFTAARPMPEFAVVADSYHIKPLLKLTQSPDRFQLLAIAADKVTLYDGNSFALTPVDLHSDVPQGMAEALGAPDHVSKTKRHVQHPEDSDQKDDQLRRYFNRVDDAIWQHHSREAGVPMILAALPEYHGFFHEVSDNQNLLEAGVRRDPFKDIDDRQLHELAWQEVLRPWMDEKVGKLIEQYQSSASRNTGSEDLATIAEMAFQNRVSHVMIEADRHIGGRLDPDSGKLELTDIQGPQVDDALDDIAQTVLDRSGQVVVLSAEQMPTNTGAAAIFRS
jgi:hypothetical protein